MGLIESDLEKYLPSVSLISGIGFTSWHENLRSSGAAKLCSLSILKLVEPSKSVFLGGTEIHRNQKHIIESTLRTNKNALYLEFQL